MSTDEQDLRYGKIARELHQATIELNAVNDKIRLESGCLFAIANHLKNSVPTKTEFRADSSADASIEYLVSKMPTPDEIRANMEKLELMKAKVRDLEQQKASLGY